MARKHACCVLDCETLGPANLFFNVPDDFRKSPKWLSIISSSDKIIDDRFLVCVHHFNKPYILVTDDGKVVAVDSNAVAALLYPSTLLNILKIPLRKKKNQMYYPDYMFYVFERDGIPVNINSKYFDTQDFLKDFATLRNGCPNKLDGYCIGWTLNMFPNFIIFFYLQENTIKSTIQIDQALRVEITLSGRLMDPLDTTRWLPPSSRITRWSQLRMILLQFGIENEKNKTFNVVFNANIKRNKPTLYKKTSAH